MSDTCNNSCPDNGSNPVFSTNQKGSDYDYQTCMVNSLLTLMSNQLGFPIDINQLACNALDDPSFPPPNWLSNINAGARQTLYYIVSRNNRLIRIPIKCDNGSNDLTDPPPCDQAICYKEMLVKLKTTKNTDCTSPKILELICGDGLPIGVNSLFLENWLNNRPNNPDPGIIPKYYPDDPLFDKNNPTSIGHAITCIGYSCTGDNICYTLQDSYTWGQNPQNQTRIFDVCVDKSSPLAKKIFTIGLPIPNMPGPVVGIELREIKGKEKECCTTTTTTTTSTTEPPTTTPEPQGNWYYQKCETKELDCSEAWTCAEGPLAGGFPTESECLDANPDAVVCPDPFCESDEDCDSDEYCDSGCCQKKSTTTTTTSTTTTTTSTTTTTTTSTTPQPTTTTTTTLQPTTNTTVSPTTTTALPTTTTPSPFEWYCTDC